jgi:CRP-like cAMP-binding protein
LNEKSVFDESRILSELPLSFRVKLVGHVFHKELSAFKYLFSRLHKGFVAQLLMNIKPYQCSIGDIIMHHGEVVTDIHFINKGVVRLSSKTFIKEAGVAKVEVIIGFSTDKGYFGDLEYFRKTNRFVDYIASAPCSCFSIDTSVIDDAGVSYVNCFGILTSEFESRSRAFMEAKKSEAVKVQSTWLRALFWDDGKLIDLKKNDAEDAGIGTAVDASGSPLTAAGHAAADNSTGESTSAMAGPSTKPIHRQQRSRRRSIVDVGEKTMYLSPLDKSPNGSEGSGSSTRVRMVKLSEDEPTIICDYQAKLDLLKRGIVLPQSKFKKGWDKFITFLLFISIVIIPLEVAYFPDSQALSNLMLVFDLIFCLDIIINFRVAYFDAEKVIIAIPKLIALKYFKTWLAFDLVTSFPYDAVVNSFSSSGRYITLVKAIRYFKMVKFFRITKLQKRETSIQEFIGADTVVFEVLKLLVQFVLLAHIVSCLYWIYCTSLSGEHWYDAYNLTDASPGDQYLVTLYFVVATLSTVGYGDIVAHTPFERLAVVCICFMAGSVMGYIVAKITAAMNTTNATERAVQERLLEVEGYLTAKNVSPGLKSLVLEQSFHKYTHASDDREEEILDILPNFLVMQIVSIHNAPDISAILLFRHIKNHSICLYIFRKLKSVYYSSGDVILSSGTVPSQVIFLVKGEVSVCKKERGIPTIAAHPNGTAPKSITSFDKAKSRLLEGKPDSSRRTDAANTNAQKSSLPVREGAATPSRHHRRGSTYQATEVTVANITAPGVLGLAAMIKGKLQDVSARAYAPCTSFNLEDSVILEILDHSPPLSLALRDAFAKLILDQRAEFKQKYRYKRFEFFSGHWSRATLARKKKQGIQSISRIKSFKSANASAQDLFVSFRSAIDAAHNWKSKSFSFRNSSLSDTENEKNPPSNSDRSAPKQPNRREGSRMTLSAPKFSTTCDLNGLSDPFENMDSQIESNRSPKRVTISPASPSRDRNTTSPSSANEDVFDVLSSPSPNRITRKPINTSALGLMTDRLSKVMPSELSSPGRILSRSSRNSKSNKVSVDSLEHITSEPTLSAESSAFSPRQMASEVQSPAADSSKLALTDASNSKNVSVSVNLNPALSIKLPSALDSQASPISSETSGSPRPSLSKKNVKLQRVKTLLLTAALEQKKKDDEAAAKSEGGSPRKNEAKNVAMRALNKKQFSFLAAQWKTLKPKYADLSRRQVGLYDSEAEDEYESVRVNSRWRSFVSGDSNQTLTTASSAVFTATSTAAELEPPDHSPSGDVPITSSSRVVLEPSRQLIFRARAMSNPFDAEVQYISGPSVKFLSNCPTGAALHPGLVSRHPLERLVHSKRRRRMSFPSADLRDWRELNTSEFMV